MDEINSLKKEIEEKEKYIEYMKKELEKDLEYLKEELKKLENIQVMKEISNNEKLKILQETDFSDREKLLIATAIGISQDPEKSMYSELDDIIKHFQKIKRDSTSAVFRNIKKVHFRAISNNTNDEFVYICHHYDNNNRVKETRIKPGFPDYRCYWNERR